MSVFQPVDVREPDSRRKKLLQKLMEQQQAANASRPGSFLAAAGHNFRTGVGPRPNVTHGSNIAQSILDRLGVTGHSYAEEVSPGNGAPIAPPRPTPAPVNPAGPPIPVNPGNGGGQQPAAGGPPAPVAPSAPVQPPFASQQTPALPPIPSNIINTGNAGGFDAASSALIHLGGGWVFDPHLGKMYQLPDAGDNTITQHGAVY